MNKSILQIVALVYIFLCVILELKLRGSEPVVREALQVHQCFYVLIWFVLIPPFLLSKAGSISKNGSALIQSQINGNENTSICDWCFCMWVFLWEKVRELSALITYAG